MNPEFQLIMQPRFEPESADLPALLLLGWRCRSAAIVNQLSTDRLAHRHCNAIGDIIDELSRQCLRKRPTAGILQPVFQMRRWRVSAVAALPDYVALLDLGSLLHLNAVLLQVHQQRILLAAVRDQDTIAPGHYLFRPAWHIIGI